MREDGLFRQTLLELLECLQFLGEQRPPTVRCFSACRQGQWSGHLGVVLEEPLVDIAHPEKSPQVLLATWARRLFQPPNVLILNFDFPPARNVAQVLHFLSEKVPFLDLEGYDRVAQRGEDLAEVLDVVVRRLREDDDAFEIY